MSSLIHPTSYIDPSAQIADDVKIGPFCTIGPKTTLGKGCVLTSHVVIEGYTRMGQNCVISPQAVIGGTPQDLGFKGEESWVELGNNVTIREAVTINRATGEGNVTRVGSGSFLMAYAHLAHNCEVGDRVIMANGAQMGGYVTIGDHAFVSAMTVAHQFVRIGRLAIVSGSSGTRQDIPPFSISEGRPATLVGINKIGMRRQDFSAADRMVLQRAFHDLWFSDLGYTEAFAKIRKDSGEHPLTEELIAFIQSSKRGIRQPKNHGMSETAIDCEEPDNHPLQPIKAPSLV